MGRFNLAGNLRINVETFETGNHARKRTGVDFKTTSLRKNYAMATPRSLRGLNQGANSFSSRVCAFSESRKLAFPISEGRGPSKRRRLWGLGPSLFIYVLGGGANFGRGGSGFSCFGGRSGAGGWSGGGHLVSGKNVHFWRKICGLVMYF